MVSFMHSRDLFKNESTSYECTFLRIATTYSLTGFKTYSTIIETISIPLATINVVNLLMIFSTNIFKTPNVLAVHWMTFSLTIEMTYFITTFLTTLIVARIPTFLPICAPALAKDAHPMVITEMATLIAFWMA